MTRIREYLPEIKKAGGSLFTQMMLSGTNFLVGILLARAARKEEYALFVLASTTLLVLASLQNALVNTPLTVFLPGMPKEKGGAFLGGLYRGQWMGFLPLWILMGGTLAAFYLDKPGWLSQSQLYMLAALWLAIPPFLAREFNRAVLYFRMKIRQILWVDFSFVVPYLAGVMILTFYFIPRAFQVVLLLFVGYLFSAGLAAVFRSRDDVPVKPDVRSAFSQTWPHTRWSLLSIIVYNVKTYGYVFIVTAFAGLKDTADISAARLFLMPFLVILNSSQRYLLVRGAQWLHQKGENGFRRIFRYLLLAMLILWALYGLCLMVGFPLAVKHVLTGKYANIFHLVWLWAGFAFLRTITFLLSQSMQILKRFKMLSLANAASGVVMLLLSFPLTYWIGAPGALGAMLAGEFIFALIVWPYYRRPVKVEAV
ncbi:MAG: hypothetical protein Kow0037_29360 [Calditrichia bacterium]